MESDYIKVKSLVDVPNQITLRSTEPVRESSNDVFYYWDNGIRVNETRRKIQFKEIPTEIKGALNISVFDRTNNMIKVNAGLGLGTLSSIGTTVTVNGSNTTPLQEGYKITCSGDTIAIASITDDYTFELETAPPVDWATETYTYVKSDDTVPNLPNYSNIKPYLQLKGNDGVDDVYEYVRVSYIKGNSDNTVYTIYITGWDLRHTEVNHTFVVGDSVREISFVMDYACIPKTLVNDTDECMLPEEVARMVVYYSAFLAYTRQSRPNLAVQALSKFEAQKKEVEDELKIEKADAYNNVSSSSINRWW